MKSSIIFLIILTVALVQSCQKDIVKINSYEKNMLELSISKSISHLQSKTERDILLKNRVKTMSTIAVGKNDNKIDSLTFVEFDFGGRILRRTTIENTTQGCLPHMIRQEFLYSKDKLKKITNYTFKYKTNSVLKNWIETDTSRMRMFDWEDYSYSGDTVIVESGYAIHKYVHDENKNIIKRLTFTKTDRKTDTLEYIYSSSSIKLVLDSDSYQQKLISDYLVESNKVIINSKRGENKFRIENIFDVNGLLAENNFYLNDSLASSRIISYSFY